MEKRTESLFWKIKHALDDEDIEGLLAIDCPRDEYDGEASLIEDGICKLSDFGKRSTTPAEIANIIEQIWNLEFGPFEEREIEWRRPHYQSVAKKISG